jgi:hypothetical protein
MVKTGLEAGGSMPEAMCPAKVGKQEIILKASGSLGK